MSNVSSGDGMGIEIDVQFVGATGLLNDFTINEVTLGESLLTPGLQTTVVAHSSIHTLPIKNFDIFKKLTVAINIKRNILSKSFNMPDSLAVKQVVYRLQDRIKLDNNNEQMSFRACDQTLLNDAANLVSKSWKCTSPSKIVDHVLRSCAGATNVEIEQSGPARDYIAENIHPFQVVAQQANMALAKGDDPSFIHYMTYEKFGTHHFRSLLELVKQEPVMTFYASETGSITGFGNPYSILEHSFPCDFDLLSDILNGIDENGKHISSLAVFNPLLKMFSLVGNQTVGCGIGGGNSKIAQTNYNSSSNQNSCNSEVEKYLLKRQARMSLLEKDKIALRLTVPWNPSLHAGKVIRVELQNKQASAQKIYDLNYGSGDYLILHMTHNIKRGGFGTTTMDCVSSTVGQGIV